MLTRQEILAPQFPKTCSCGAVYTASEWEKLPHPPHGSTQCYPWGEEHDLRNCTCGTTLAVVTREGEMGDYPMDPEKMHLGNAESCSPADPDVICNFDKVKYSSLWIDVCAKRRRKNLGPVVKNAAEAARQLVKHAPWMLEDQREYVVALLLNNNHRLVGLVELARGVLKSALVDPADLVRASVLTSAPRVIVAHNHPSGDATLSPEDMALADGLQAALRAVKGAVLDCIAIARGPDGEVRVGSLAEPVSKVLAGFGGAMDLSRRDAVLNLIEKMWDYPNDPAVLDYLDGMKQARADAGREASIAIARGLKVRGERRDTEALEDGLRQLQSQVENASEQQVQNYYDELDAWAAANDRPNILDLPGPGRWKGYGSSEEREMGRRMRAGVAQEEAEWRRYSGAERAGDKAAVAELSRRERAYIESLRTRSYGDVLGNTVGTDVYHLTAIDSDKEIWDAAGQGKWFDVAILTAEQLNARRDWYGGCPLDDSEGAFVDRVLMDPFGPEDVLEGKVRAIPDDIRGETFSVMLKIRGSDGDVLGASRHGDDEVPPIG